MSVLAAQLPDLHIYERRDFEDRLAALDQMIEIGIARSVNVWLVPGDLYHTRSTAAERLALVQRFARMAEHAPVVGCRGNHDAPGEVLMFNWLRTTHPIRFHEEPALEEFPFARIIVVPHIDKGQDIAGLPETTLRERALFMLDGARELVADQDAADPRPVILLTHLGVEGAALSKGETLPGLAAEITFPELKTVGADYAALGHIHAMQKFPLNAAGYAGSGILSDWGEEGQAKGFLLVSIGTRGTMPYVEICRIHTRRWLTMTARWENDGWSLEGMEPERIAAEDVVRFRIIAPADKVVEIEEARKEAAAQFQHVYRLEWDIQRTGTAKEANPELAEAETPADMLDAYWNADPDTAPPELIKTACKTGLKELEADIVR